MNPSRARRAADLLLAASHVDFDDCCDHASGQRKRYLRAENERLASIVPPPHVTSLLAGVGDKAEGLKDL